jgi:hypothetical protein
MPFLHQLATAFSPWADLYNASRPMQAAMMFGHLGGMMAGGGTALHADRATLRLRGTEAEIGEHLVELRRAHPVVLSSLAVMALTGLAMLLADLESLAVAPVFWIKMGLVALLLLNGSAMLHLERRMASPPLRSRREWSRLRRASALSLALWLTVVLLGSLLPIIT